MQGEGEALFFLMHGASDKVGMFGQLGIGIAHHFSNLAGHLVHEGFVHANERGKAQGAADQAAQHIATTLVGGQHAASHKEGRRAAVVGNDAQGRIHVVGVGRAEAVAHIGERGGVLDDLLKQVAVKIGALALGNGGHAFKAHARINVGIGKSHAGAVGRLVKLGEHEVPDFKEPVAVALADAAVRPARHVCTLIHIDFGTGAARAGIAHGPEIVFFAHAHDAVGGQPGNLGPDGRSFVIFAEHRDPELFLGQFKLLAYKFPGPGDGFALEIVAERKVAQHFKKRVVARGAAHVFKVVVFARNTQAFLAGSGAAVCALFLAKKQLFELHHASIGEQQGGVVGRNDGAGFDNFMLVAFEKFEVAAADFFGGEHLLAP